MAIRVHRAADAGEVLEAAGSFLESSPVLNNVVLTLLWARRLQPEAGRYWIVDEGPDILGVAF